MSGVIEWVVISINTPHPPTKKKKKKKKKRVMIFISK